ncbi:response regulator transcription factor [Actinoplanes sp. NPDC049265]|uniref:response regulator transcription factor n=1 Tax=Actinoplanes sp. NPDC049265 TaxID=3363902 RepID=UPI0037214025
MASGFPRAVGITAHQLRIAQLVVAGNTNDEIAARLNVSRRTVEFHLTNLYRQLAIRRRSQLALALNRVGLLEW